MRCDLAETVSLVTGAARGIGQSIADALAANGSRVIYTDVDEAGARQAAARIPGASSMPLDVTRVDEVEEVDAGGAAELLMLQAVPCDLHPAGVQGPGLWCTAEQAEQLLHHDLIRSLERPATRELFLKLLTEALAVYR